MQVLPMTQIKHQVGHSQPHHTTHPHINTHPAYRHQGTQINTQTDNIEQQVHQTPPNFNQSVVDLLRHQTELANSTQCLHQKPQMH